MRIKSIRRRPSDKQLIEETAKTLKKKGFEKNMQAKILLNLSDYVMQIRTRILIPVIAKPKLRQNQAWINAYTFVNDFLKQYKMYNTLHTILVELNGKNRPFNPNLFSKMSRAEYYSKIIRFSTKLSFTSRVISLTTIKKKVKSNVKERKITLGQEKLKQSTSQSSPLKDKINQQKPFQNISPIEKTKKQKDKTHEQNQEKYLTEHLDDEIDDNPFEFEADMASIIPKGGNKENSVEQISVLDEFKLTFKSPEKLPNGSPDSKEVNKERHISFIGDSSLRKQQQKAHHPKTLTTPQKSNKSMIIEDDFEDSEDLSSSKQPSQSISGTDFIEDESSQTNQLQNKEEDNDFISGSSAISNVESLIVDDMAKSQEKQSISLKSSFIQDQSSIEVVSEKTTIDVEDDFLSGSNEATSTSNSIRADNDNSIQPINEKIDDEDFVSESSKESSSVIESIYVEDNVTSKQNLSKQSKQSFTSSFIESQSSISYKNKAKEDDDLSLAESIFVDDDISKNSVSKNQRNSKNYSNNSSFIQDQSSSEKVVSGFEVIDEVVSIDKNQKSVSKNKKDETSFLIESISSVKANQSADEQYDFVDNEETIKEKESGIIEEIKSDQDPIENSSTIEIMEDNSEVNKGQSYVDGVSQEIGDDFEDADGITISSDDGYQQSIIQDSFVDVSVSGVKSRNSVGDSSLFEVISDVSK